MSRDEDGFQRGAVDLLAIGDDRHRLDGRSVDAFKCAQQTVLPYGQALIDLLDRVHILPQTHEPHGVPGDAPRQADQAILRPSGQRDLQRQLEQGGVGRRGRDVHPSGIPGEPG